MPGKFKVPRSSRTPIWTYLHPAGRRLFHASRLRKYSNGARQRWLRGSRPVRPRPVDSGTLPAGRTLSGWTVASALFHEWTSEHASHRNLRPSKSVVANVRGSITTPVGTCSPVFGHSTVTMPMINPSKLRVRSQTDPSVQLFLGTARNGFKRPAGVHGTTCVPLRQREAAGYSLAGVLRGSR
jgi:hypothetical protein